MRIELLFGESVNARYSAMVVSVILPLAAEVGFRAWAMLQPD
jgi:hypothetical protein